MTPVRMVRPIVKPSSSAGRMERVVELERELISFQNVSSGLRKIGSGLVTHFNGRYGMN